MNEHYKNLEIEPIEYITKNKLGFCEGNIIKYVSRYKYKNGLEDLKKAKFYIDYLIENYQIQDTQETQVKVYRNRCEIPPELRR